MTQRDSSMTQLEIPQIPARPMGGSAAEKGDRGGAPLPGGQLQFARKGL